MEKIIELIKSGSFWGSVLTSAVVVTIINVVWKYIENKISFKQSKQLQIDNFYREISGDKMYKVLKRWSELLFFATDKKVEKKLQDDKYLNNLFHETYIYSSNETIKRLSNFQQYLYDKRNKDEDFESYTVMVLIAGIITSVKYDFTGEAVGLKEVLKIKLTDVYENMDSINRVMKQYSYK